MSHGIWANRFYNRDNKPAWHALGTNNVDPRTAVKTLEEIGEYGVVLVPNTVTLPDGTMQQQDYSTIYRLPTTDDPRYVPFGAPVHKSYELIGPREAAQIWDEALLNAAGEMVPVETLGVLHDGKELFISAVLHNFEVKGDEIKMYQVLHNPMYSNNAAMVIRTAFRPVCANTLALGIKNAIVTKTIVHTPGAKAELFRWIKDMYLDSVKSAKQVKSDFETMAIKWIDVPQTNSLLAKIIEDPMKPQPEWDGQFGVTFADHLRMYEEKMVKVESERATVFNLFSGDGVGMDHDSVDGTCFGLYNAVAEYQDNRRGAAKASAIGVLTGDRGSAIRKAYRVLVDYSRN